MEKWLQNWLSKQSSLRLATDADCECAEDIELMRNEYNGLAAAVRDYHPYQVSGDFKATVMTISPWSLSKAERRIRLGWSCSTDR